ncbi:DUF6069 family protein [Kribbella sp. NBC_01505]|uniref:DUF6069 family protein n=1 Tax=Kribbella sp. NBC_01505 TaxID=2903580 RepID=UPI003865BF10
MAATLSTVSTATTNAPSVGRLLRDGVVASVLAAVATAAVAGAGQAAGISLNVSGAPIPVVGFAVMTAIFATVGLLIALGLRRFTARPRTAWLRTTVVLTALSFVPDLLSDAAPTTKALLMTTHLIAAVIIVPAVARRLS